MQRPDDSEETIRHRIATYHRETKPLVDYYTRKAGTGAARSPRYVSIKATGAVEGIRDELFAALGAGK